MSSAPSAENSRPVMSELWNCGQGNAGGEAGVRGVRQRSGQGRASRAGQAGQGRGPGRGRRAVRTGGQIGAGKPHARGGQAGRHGSADLPGVASLAVLHIKHTHRRAAERHGDLPAVGRQSHVLQCGECGGEGGVREEGGRKQGGWQSQEGRSAAGWAGMRARQGGEGLHSLTPPTAAATTTPRNPPHTKPPPMRTHPPTCGVSGSWMQLMHCPLSRAHRRTQSSKEKVASMRAASQMAPPSTLSVWPAGRRAGGGGSRGGAGARWGREGGRRVSGAGKVGRCQCCSTAH